MNLTLKSLGLTRETVQRLTATPTLRSVRLSREEVMRITSGMRPAPTNGADSRYPRELVLRVREMRDAGATYRAISLETGLSYTAIIRAIHLSEDMQ